MMPSPLTSLDVWIPGTPLRSMQSFMLLAILVTDDWCENARLATHTSPLKSTAVREGRLSYTFTPALLVGLRSQAQQPFEPLAHRVPAGFCPSTTLSCVAFGLVCTIPIESRTADWQVTVT